MDRQNQIKRRLSESTSIQYVRQLIGTDPSRCRSQLAAAVCERFKFIDPRGQLQQSGCLKALRELEEAGHFDLPARRTRGGDSSPRALGEPVGAPQEVPCHVDEVRGLELVLVSSQQQRRLWNQMMIDEHPLGAGPFVGRQLRYLVGSEHGWLGGVGFAAAALQLGPRDRWIGWDHEQRREHLHGVVGMSRFLIRAGVQCRNLSSKVLSRVMEVLCEDFEKRYDYRPWLVESFVDLHDHSGISYQAANWICVGQTQGRGRQDRFARRSLSRKAIYVYGLKEDFRTVLGLAEPVGPSALEATEGLEAEHWAENEFGGAPLGDERLSKRLVKIAQAKYEQPWRAYCGVAQGDWASLKGYYRLIDKPEESQVSMQSILEPHRQRTVRRMMGQPTVLCIQDGSLLNYNSLSQCEGLGEMGTNQTGAVSRGLYLHTTFAVSTGGLPLGVVHAQCIAPEGKAPNEDRPVCRIPIEEKKTFSWIEHHRDLVKLAGQMPQNQLVEVCDREADFFEMFEEQRRDRCVQLLVRAQHNHKLEGQSLKLFEAVARSPEQGRIQITLPHQSARPKRSKQKARPKREKRTVKMALRYMRVALPPPSYQKGKDPIDLWVIHAVEQDPPPANKPIEWFLLTPIELTSLAVAEQCLAWYCLRWRIEDWHRVLKSGCCIEKLTHATAERLRRAIAINLVIAWRIMVMTLLGREAPHLPAEVLFSDIEVKTLRAYAKKKALKIPTELNEAVRLVARIGGYLGRKTDHPPGYQIMWQGHVLFQFMCEGFALTRGDDNRPG